MNEQAGETSRSIVIHPVRDGDREAVMALAPRLMAGMAPWRDPDGCLAAVRRWVEASMARPSGDGVLFVARDSGGRVTGFASVEVSTHFSGEREAHVGELAVDERAEGQGVGRALVAAAESWAREQGLRTLTLVTGAANERARGFYARLGFREEEVRLTRLLE